MQFAEFSGTAPRERYRVREAFDVNLPDENWLPDEILRFAVGNVSGINVVSPWKATLRPGEGQIEALPPQANVFWTDLPSASTSRLGWLVFAQVKESEGTGNTSTPKLSSETIREWYVDRSLARLYAIAEDERFEDGMESNLGVGLKALFARYPHQTLRALGDLLRATTLRWQVTAETLNVLGRIESAETIDARRFLVAEFLNHRSVLVRDAALIAICLLGDGRAIPDLERAAAREPNASLRLEIEKTIQQLRR